MSLARAQQLALTRFDLNATNRDDPVEKEAVMGKRALALGVVCCFALGCRAARHESAGWRFQFRPLETLADAVLEGFSHQARDEIERANGDNYRRYQKANRNSFEWNDSPTSGWIPSSDTAQPGADSW